MKIAVATNDGLTVAGHVGRCKSFVIFSIEDQTITHKEIRSNSFTHHMQHQHNHSEEHSHGHSHSGLINALEGCEALIFKSGGWRLVDDLKSNNIKPFLTDEESVEQAAAKYAKGELEIKDDNVCNDH